MVEIFDTTLRDGEQSPGVALNNFEKLEIAKQLAKLNVSIIEAGFPISSEGDFQAVKTIAEQVEGPVICALARAVSEDIKVAAQAIQASERPRIHTFISSSDIHISQQMESTREDVLKQAIAAVDHAASYNVEVQFSPMDATRSDLDYVTEMCLAAVEHGATVINIPDTVGYTVPQEYQQIISCLRDALPEQVKLAVHCHNDLGLAVANSLAGITAGARQVECSVNGIGERAGNCSLEEIVLALKTRSDVLPYKTDIVYSEIARASKLVSMYTGYSIAPNKAIVGRNAFSHESGIHQDGVLKNPGTYEIMDPAEIGIQPDQIVLGKHSGRHALREELNKLGYQLDGQQLNKAFKDFKLIADRKQHVSLHDLEALVSDQITNPEETYALDWFEVNDSSSGQPEAEVLINSNGDKMYGQASGDGAIDALFAAIAEALNINCHLLRYSVDSVTEGEDALAEVSVIVEGNGKTVTGQAINPDTVRASGKAYLRAISALT